MTKRTVRLSSTEKKRSISFHEPEGARQRSSSFSLKAKALARNTFTVGESEHSRGAVRANGTGGSETEASEDDENQHEGDGAEEGLDVFAAIDAAVAEVSLPKVHAYSEREVYQEKIQTKRKRSRNHDRAASAGGAIFGKN